MGSYPFINYPLPGIINVLYPVGDNVKTTIYLLVGITITLSLQGDIHRLNILMLAAIIVEH